jgi:hypothetical protein
VRRSVGARALYLRCVTVVFNQSFFLFFQGGASFQRAAGPPKREPKSGFLLSDSGRKIDVWLGKNSEFSMTALPGSFLKASPTMHSAARLLLRCGARRLTCRSPSPALVLSCDGLGCRPTDIRGWNGNLKAGERAFCVQGAHSSVFQPPGDADDASGFVRGKDKGFRVEGLGYRVKGIWCRV